MSAFDVDQTIYTSCPCGQGQIETQVGTPGHCWSMEQITRRKIICAICSFHWQYNWKDELVKSNKKPVLQQAQVL